MTQILNYLYLKIEIYRHSHFSLLPMNDWGDKKNMEKIIAKSITFDEICRQYNRSFYR